MTTYTVQTLTLQRWTHDAGDGPSVLLYELATLDRTALLAGLVAERAIGPAAYDSPILDVIHQVNNVNGGELVVLVDGKRYGLED